MGRKEQALQLLEQAAKKGWLKLNDVNMQLNELPWLENLKGNPRFERLQQIAEARLIKERRETDALAVI